MFEKELYNIMQCYTICSQVTEDDSDQNIYKNLIIQRMVPKIDSQPVQNFHRNWQNKRNAGSTQLRCLPYFFIIGTDTV